MKNKKFLVATMTLAGLMMTLPMVSTVSADAEKTLSSVDEYFLEFVSDDIGNAQIEYTSSPLYDETLTVSGYEYTFEVAGQGGYALLQEVQIGDSIFYEVEELKYNGVSPFAESEGLPIYITFCLYLDYVDGVFYDLTTGNTASEETLSWAMSRRFGYNGGGTFTAQSYTVSYDHKTTISYDIQYGIPNYEPTTGTSCANAAGTMLIGYYDRFYENLVPNEQTYVMIGTTVVYRAQTTAIHNICLEMYDLMGTTSSGTSFSGFNAGMTSYVQGQGYSYSTTSMLTSGSFDFNKYKTAVEAGKPVALFLNGYAIYTYTSTESGVDTIHSDVSSYTHVAIGCGYKYETYYDANNNVVSTQKYLRVASGLATYGMCYLNINAYTTINNAISVAIQ